MTDATAGDEIRVAGGVYTGVVPQVVFINKSMVIRGGYTTTNWTTPDSAINPSVLDAQNQGRVVYATGSISIVLEGLTLLNGSAGLVAAGGALYTNAASVILTGCQVLSSTAANGGGVANFGVMTITNSTIAGNAVDGVHAPGGGVDNENTMTIYSTTIMGNSAVIGSGIYNSGVMNVYTATIRDNVTSDLGFGNGGGILNLGSFNLNNSAVVSNSSVLGGGIRNHNLLAMTNTTVSWNRSLTGGLGAGIANTGGVLSVTNSTIVSNTGSVVGAGIGNASLVTIRNTIVAYNANANCDGVLNSLGHNIDSGNSCGFTATGDLTNTAPALDVPGYYSGSTLTYGLRLNSPALDAGDDLGCPATDQRGVLRPKGRACDIGAFEQEVYRHYLSIVLLTPP